MGIFSKAFWQNLWSRARLSFRSAGVDANELTDIALSSESLAVKIFSNRELRKKLSAEQIISVINHYEQKRTQTFLSVFPSSLISSSLREFAKQDERLALKLFSTPQYRQYLSVDDVVDIVNFYENQKPPTFLNTFRASISNTLREAAQREPSVDYHDTSNIDKYKNLLVAAKILKPEDLAAPELTDPVKARHNILHIILVMFSTLDEDFTPEQKIKMALEDVDLARNILYNPRITHNLKAEHIAQIINGYLKPAPIPQAGQPQNPPANLDLTRKQQFIKIINKGGNTLYETALDYPILAETFIDVDLITDPQQVVGIVLAMPVEFLVKYWEKIKAALTGPTAAQTQKDFFEALTDLDQFCKIYAPTDLTPQNIDEIIEYLKAKLFLGTAVALIQQDDNPLLTTRLTADLKKYNTADVKNFLENANKSKDEPLSEVASSSSDASSDASPASLSDSDSESAQSTPASIRSSQSRTTHPERQISNIKVKQAANQERAEREQISMQKREAVGILLRKLYRLSCSLDNNESQFTRTPPSQEEINKARELINADIVRIHKSLEEASRQGSVRFTAALYPLELSSENHFALIEIALDLSDNKGLVAGKTALSEQQRKEIAAGFIFNYSPNDFSIALKTFNLHYLESLFNKYKNDQLVMDKMFAFLRRCRDVANMRGNLFFKSVAQGNLKAVVELAIKNDAFADKLFSSLENGKIIAGDNKVVTTAIILSKLYGPDFLKRHLDTLVLAAISNKEERKAFLETTDPSLLALLNTQFPSIQETLKTQLTSTLATEIKAFNAQEGMSEHQALMNALSKISGDRSTPDERASSPTGSSPNLKPICVTNIQFNNRAAKSIAATTLQCTTEQLDNSLFIFPTVEYQEDVVRTFREHGIKETDYELVPVISPAQTNIPNHFFEKHRNITHLLFTHHDERIIQLEALVKSADDTAGVTSLTNIFENAFGYALKKIKSVANLFSFFEKADSANVKPVDTTPSSQSTETSAASAPARISKDGESPRSKSPARLVAEAGMYSRDRPAASDSAKITPLIDTSKDKTAEARIDAAQSANSHRPKSPTIPK